MGSNPYKPRVADVVIKGGEKPPILKSKFLTNRFVLNKSVDGRLWEPTRCNYLYKTKTGTVDILKVVANFQERGMRSAKLAITKENKIE